MPDMLEARPAALLQILEIATHAGVAAAWLRLAGVLELTDDPGALFPLLPSLRKAMALALPPEDDLPAPLVAIATLLVRPQAQPVADWIWIGN